MPLEEQPNQQPNQQPDPQPNQQPNPQPNQENYPRPLSADTKANSSKGNSNVLELVSNALEKIRSLVFSAIVIFLFILVCIFSVREIKKDYIIIEPFEVPEALVKDGYTGSVVAKQLLDEINRVKKFAVDSAYYGYSVESINLIATTDKSEINFEVPVAGINLNSLIFFVRDYLDRDPDRISGEVLIHSDSLKINVRYGDLITSVVTPKNKINKEFESVAVNILKESQPLMIVNYYLAKKNDTLSEYTFKNINIKNKNIDSLDIKFFEGIFLFKRKKLTEAYERFDYVYHQDHNNIEALKNLGLVYNDLNKPEEAERLYRKLIQIDPRDYISHQRLAEVLYIQGKNHKEIENLLEKVIKINPDLNDAFYYYARIKFDDGEYEKAKEYINQGLKINPNDYYNHTMLGNVLSAVGDYKGAEISYRKAIKVNPVELSTYQRLAEMYLINGQLAKSEYVCDQILKKNKNYANAYSTKGKIYVQKKMYNKSEEMYRKAYAIAPNDADIYLSIGQVMERQGRAKDAQDLYISASKLYPKNASAHNSIAKLYYNQGMYPEAEENLRKATILEKNDAVFHYNLATVLDEQGKTKEAVRETKVTLSLSNNFADAYNLLGSLVERSGKLAEAENMYRKALKYDSTKYIYYSNLGNVLESEERNAEAAEMYQRAIALDTSNSDIFVDLGLSLVKLNKLEEAKISYKKSIRLNSKNVNAQYALALLTEKENPVEAEKLYRVAIKLDSNSIYARNRLAAMLSRFGKIKESQSLLKESIRIDSNSLNAYYQMGINYCKNKDFYSAKKSFLFAIKKDKKYFRSIIDINYLFNRSYNNSVRGTYVNLYTLSYDVGEAYFWLAKILESEKKYEHALQYYNMAVVADGDYEPAYLAAENLLNKIKKSTGYNSIYKIVVY